MQPQKDYASKINKILKQIYTVKGLEEMTKVAEELLKSKQCKSDENFRNIVHGEVCETVLECYLDNYIMINNLEGVWFYEKGMVLKDMTNPDSEYLTEVDMTLFTPFKLLTFECKCYGGGKLVVDECKIVRKGIKPYDVFAQHKKHIMTLFTPFKLLTFECKCYGGGKLVVDECKIVRKGIKPYDVFAQHKKHIETLMNNLYRFRLDTEYSRAYSPIDAAYFDFSLGNITDKRDAQHKKHIETLMNNLYRFRLDTEYSRAYSPIDAAYFDFSLGNITDKRDVGWKKKMPVLNVENLYKHLDNYRGKPECWNITGLRRGVAAITKYKEILRKKHLRYVKELNRKRESKKK